jgi:hypothetical protein
MRVLCAAAALLAWCPPDTEYVPDGLPLAIYDQNAPLASTTITVPPEFVPDVPFNVSEPRRIERQRPYPLAELWPGESRGWR